MRGRREMRCEMVAGRLRCGGGRRGATTGRGVEVAGGDGRGGLARQGWRRGWIERLGSGLGLSGREVSFLFFYVGVGTGAFSWNMFIFSPALSRVGRPGSTPYWRRPCCKWHDDAAVTQHEAWL